jgi:hypothetical protein
VSRSSVLIVVLLTATLASSACRRESAPASGDPPPPIVTDVQRPPPAEPPAREAQRAATPAPAPVQPVDPERLKPVLVEVIGWTRTMPRAEMMSTPVAFSKAEARYDRPPASVQIEVHDTGLNQVLLAGISMFLAAGFEERAADGYKKSGTYQGHPGFEEWRSDTRRGEINVLVSNRFVVNAIGQRLRGMDELREIVGAIDTRTLAALK